VWRVPGLRLIEDAQDGVCARLQRIAFRSADARARAAYVHRGACLVQPWEHPPPVFGLLPDLVPGDRRHCRDAAESVTALRLPAEERRGDLVQEHFRAEPAPEQRGEILERVDLGQHRTELQSSQDIFDRMLARQFVCIHRVRRRDGKQALHLARE
jgi:hypothetical protein